MLNTNSEIRHAIDVNGIKYWEVAKKIGISAGNLSVWMREELTGSRKERVEAAVNELIEERKA